MSEGDSLHDEVSAAASSQSSQRWINLNNSLSARLGVRSDIETVPPRQIERISVLDDDNSEIETRSDVRHKLNVCKLEILTCDVVYALTNIRLLCCL